MRENVPNTTYWCSCCGKRIEDSFAEHQYDESSRTEGSVCRDCGEWSMILDYKNAFPKIRDSLNEEQRERWDEASDFEKAIFAAKLHQEGQLQIKEITKQ